MDLQGGLLGQQTPFTLARRLEHDCNIYEGRSIEGVRGNSMHQAIPDGAGIALLKGQPDKAGRCPEDSCPPLGPVPAWFLKAMSRPW